MLVVQPYLGILIMLMAVSTISVAYGHTQLQQIHPMVQFGNLPDFGETTEVTFTLTDYHNITYQAYSVEVGFATYGGFDVVGMEPTRVETVGNETRHLYVTPAVVDKANGNTEFRVNITATTEGVFPFELIHIVWPSGTYESHSSILNYRIEDGVTV